MSPDEAAFLEAIRDNPTDETTRLVYADWLADRDDSRAAFVRFSADFLRYARELKNRHSALPTEWLDVIDPYRRFFVLRVPSSGGANEHPVVTAVFVKQGDSAVSGQSLIEISEDKASFEITAEHTGTIVSVFVRPGDRVSIGQPVLTYLSSQEIPCPATSPTPLVLPSRHLPTVPFHAFIRELERRREVMRTTSSARINAIIAHQRTAAAIVFGRGVVLDANNAAESHRGWAEGESETRMREHGLTDEQMAQERLDIHIETLRLLLTRYGQPDGFSGLPELPDEPTSE
ncbi:Pyruvate/2-oxoglutarate dehydrogenase complex, dihydrolipoamide acyltransferase component OS=Thermus oshimai JL-2 GN=Theos_2160 PE=3 SV=1: Biotin_lipoyl [Gemmata massiliana]|uniref:Lipoyl-binding domain-containing protein n=1 Tax=Gemmata massiliana TaxID=1210884 RepID=A0A6P2DNI4_9BACT|nr:TIGR02996 domain-containing protein [Gemmata massiliana]VTS03894.1 Pyruvate/2-oxoglutarate dehydrogenase complex, dihydrolipoamide acyltransferase component OS=Thermus oshimai JL-2 GN=Theos_2160 PE=3 SV=1: Biotin_lipoyl [Gemmata massiliana]